MSSISIGIGYHQMWGISIGIGWNFGIGIGWNFGIGTTLPNTKEREGHMKKPKLGGVYPSLSTLVSGLKKPNSKIDLEWGGGSVFPTLGNRPFRFAMLTMTWYLSCSVDLGIQYIAEAYPIDISGIMSGRQKGGKVAISSPVSLNQWSLLSKVIYTSFLTSDTILHNIGHHPA